MHGTLNRVGYVTILFPIFHRKSACSFSMSGEQAPIMTRKMETIISRPAFGRASTNQRKKKETKRKLGVVRGCPFYVVKVGP